MEAISRSAPHIAVPVEPPTSRPVIREVQRIAAIEAASGTETIASTTDGMNDGSTRGRPMPSMREPRPVTTVGSEADQPSKKALFSGSTTQTLVS